MTRRGAAVVLANSLARRASRPGWREIARSALGSRFEVEVLEPESAAEVTRLARECAASGCEVVVAAGGDGTVNAVAAGLAGSESALGILPLGTADDLARELGIPRDPGAAAQRIALGRPHGMDLGVVNGRPFCTVGGLVLVSQSALMVDRLKRRSPAWRRTLDVLGGGVYRLAATLELVARRRIRDRVRLEYAEPGSVAPVSMDLEVHAVFVANHRTLGDGLTLPIANSATDGVLEICLVPRRSRPSLLLNFARLSSGKPLPAGVLEVARATDAVIVTEHADTFVADGESLAEGHRFEIGVMPGALQVLL